MVRTTPADGAAHAVDLVDLAAGEWVIQNVANSAVGRLPIVQAHQRGLRTVNVVCRASRRAAGKRWAPMVVLVRRMTTRGARRRSD